MANKVRLMYYYENADEAFCNGFADSAEELFTFAFGVHDISTLDQQVLKDINKTGTMYYTNMEVGIQYQSTLEKLKEELSQLKG